MKTYLKLFLRKMFEMGQLVGIDILPRHYYSEIPNIKNLKASYQWKKPSTMIDVGGWDLAEQLIFFQDIAQFHDDMFSSRAIYEKSCKKNGSSGFGPIEADFLFRFICRKQPERIVQIGCGVSTAVILFAANKIKYTPQISCVEPYPSHFLINEHNMRTINLISEKAQNVPIENFLELCSGDLLFIDSTHTVSPGSEVVRILLEVMPRLKKGVFVHFHDIYFPYDYQRDILTTALFFHNESILLHALLLGSSKFMIKAALSALHYYHPEELKKYFPQYIPQPNDYGLCSNKGSGHFPSSIYLQVTEE